MTLTDESAMAAAAMIGDNRMPKTDKAKSSNTSMANDMFCKGELSRDAIENASSTRRCKILWCAFVLALLTFTYPPSSHAQQGPCSAVDRKVTVSKAFYTGVELNALTDHDLAMYAAGYVDALQAATVIGVTEQCRGALQMCVVGRSSSELAALVRKYLRENPSRLTGQSHALLYNAIFSRCLREQP